MAKKIRAFRAFTPLSEYAHKSVKTNGGRVYKGVVLIKAGLGNKRDKNYYPPDALQHAVESGQFEGLRAFADHPDSVSDEIQPERTIRDMVGVYENSHWDDKHQSVRADLRVLKSHNWLSETIDELIDTGHADKIGLSINGQGQTRPEKMRLEESGEEEEVNRLERFVQLRSTDVVTEAGAGGGFAQLLESARRSSKETPMGRDELLTQLREAAASGDVKKVKQATDQLEAFDAGSGTKGKKTKEAKRRTAPKAAPVVDEDDEDDADKDAEAADEEALDEEVDAIKAATESDDDGDEDEDVEDDVEEAADEDDEDEDVEEADADVEEAEEPSEMTGVKRFRRHQQEAAIRGGGGKPTGTVSGGGSFNKPEKRPSKKSTLPMQHKTMKGTRTTGGATREAVAPVRETRSLREAQREAKVWRTRYIALQQNTRGLRENLRIRQDADRARVLLRESDIPTPVRPALVRQMIGMSNAEMKEFVRSQEALVNAITASVHDRIMESGGEDYDELEGVGSRVMESSGRDGGDAIEGLFQELGFSMRDGE